MTAKEKLCYWGFEDVVVFDNPGFDNALIGVTDDNRAVYDYDKMVVWLAITWNVSSEDARDFIDYNTLRVIPYFGATAPIVIHRFPE